MLVLAGALLAGGCGGGGSVAGQEQAAAACRAGGSTAATLAAQAASANSKYATLAVDEQALAVSESSKNSELSDGSSSDDSGLGALTQADAIGSSADLKVVGDCVTLGLPVAGK
jgi:hypothetical protein